jgi:hypothetical protein
MEGGCRLPDRRQEAQRKLSAQDRGSLEQLLVFLRKPVDAGGKNTLHRVRNDIKSIALVALGQSARQLLEEERIALSLAQDQRGKCFRNLLALEGTINDCDAVGQRQRSQQQAGRVRGRT